MWFHFHPSTSPRTGITQWYSAGLRTGWSGVRVLERARIFYHHHRVQTGSEAHPASYPMGTRGSFHGGKAAGAWSWSLTSIQCLHSPIHLHGVVLSWSTGTILPHHKNVRGNGGITPRILNLGTRWRWVISFRFRPLYSQGNSPRWPFLTGGWVGPWEGLDAVAKRNFLLLSWIEIQTSSP
jgi:hypothetical protein